jgi:hyperosmotically inducible protein
LAAGCKREEPKPTLPPPQTAPQPAPSPAPPPGTTSTEPGRTVGQTFDDETITAKVKAELLKAADVKGTDINVDTVNGTVETPPQIDRAESIARGVEGVKSVQNTLTAKSAK